MTENINMIRDLVARALGEERIIRKEAEGFFFTTRDGTPGQVKLADPDTARQLQLEGALLNFLHKETDLPVPRVLGQGQEGNYYYLLHSTPPGPTLEERLADGEGHKEKLLFSAGQYLGILHSIELHDRGLLEPNLSIQRQALYSREEYTQILNAVGPEIPLSSDLTSSLSGVDLSFFFEFKPDVLCHGDYSPQNLRAGAESITAIVEWKKARSAPPFDDLTFFGLHLELNQQQLPITPFFRGYSRIKPLPSVFLQFEEFFKYYQLLFWLYCDLKEGICPGGSSWASKVELLQKHLGNNEDWPRLKTSSPL